MLTRGFLILRVVVLLPFVLPIVLGLVMYLGWKETPSSPQMRKELGGLLDE